MSTNEAPRELVSSGTAQSWFKKYFSDDTMPPSANHAPEGSITASAAAASVSVGTGQEDDDQESTSSDARDSGGTAQPVSSLSMSTTSSNSNAEKRPRCVLWACVGAWAPVPRAGDPVFAALCVPAGKKIRACQVLRNRRALYVRGL